MKRSRRQVTTPHERARRRLEESIPHWSNDQTRAMQLVFHNVCDNDGGAFITTFSNERIITIIEMAREFEAELERLEAEERAFGTLRVVRGGRKV